jgi:radical SAM protein with 4Fe4S-binding SPASM domain
MERGLPLKLKTVGTRINAHEVVAMRAFAEQELGVEFKFDSLLNPRIDCSQAPLEVRLSPEEVVALDLHWPKMASEYRQLLERSFSSPAESSKTVYVCGGGVKSFAIDPYGHMSICVISHRETYDIRKGSVREGWDQFLLKVRQRERTRPTKCDTCRIQSVCSTCPATGELETGDPESPVDFLCEVAHLRAMALGFEIPPHGNCEFCEDARRAELKGSAARIASHEMNPAEWFVPRPLLPILNNAAASSCGGCGSFH